VKIAPLTRIRIPTNWAGGTVADFKLGLGPCGKVVKTLTVDYLPYGAVVQQLCDDGEMKRFVYPWSQITGRIEETYFHE
jgi:hypothetical protein